MASLSAAVQERGRQGGGREGGAKRQMRDGGGRRQAPSEKAGTSLADLPYGGHGETALVPSRPRDAVVSRVRAGVRPTPARATGRTCLASARGWLRRRAAGVTPSLRRKAPVLWAWPKKPVGTAVLARLSSATSIAGRTRSTCRGTTNRSGETLDVARNRRARPSSAARLASIWSATRETGFIVPCETVLTILVRPEAVEQHETDESSAYELRWPTFGIRLYEATHPIIARLRR